MGQYCNKPCEGLFYGYLCSNSCECPKSYCHHIYGCRRGNILDGNLGSSSMKVSTLGISKPSETRTSYSFDSTSTTMPESQMTGKLNIFTNSSVTTSPKLLENITLIIAIGGLIAFFLCIISIQTCVKLFIHMRRRRTSKQVAEQIDTVKVDETKYEEVNETELIAISENNKSKHLGKSYALSTLKQDENMTYHKIDDSSERRYANSPAIEMNDELKSSGSSYLYMKPTTNRHDKHNYIELVDTTSTNEELIKDCVEIPDHASLFSVYIEPIQEHIQLDGNGQKQNARVQRDSTYLNVIKEKLPESTYLDVVHCTETRNNS